MDEPSVPEEEKCPDPNCKNNVKQLEDYVVDLNKQVDTLTTALRDVTWRYRLLKRHSHPSPPLRSLKLPGSCSLPCLWGGGGEGEPPEQPVTGPPTKGRGESSRSFQTAYPFPDHVAALSKYEHCRFLPVLCALTRHTWSFFLCFLFADQVIEEFRGHHEGRPLAQTYK